MVATDRTTLLHQIRSHLVENHLIADTLLSDLDLTRMLELHGRLHLHGHQEIYEVKGRQA